MFVVNRCNQFRLENVSLDFSQAAGRAAVIIKHGTRQDGPKFAPNMSSSLCRVANAEIIGAGQLEVGIRVKLHDVNNDDKNDFHEFENLRIDGTTWCAMVLEGRNAKNLSLKHIVCQPGPVGSQWHRYGVSTLANWCPGDPGFNETLSLSQAIYNHGASFHWHGGAGDGARAAVVVLGDRNDCLTFKDIYCEKSARFLIVPGYPNGVAGSVSHCPITLENIRFAIADLAADGEVVQITDANIELTIIGGKWGDRIADKTVRFRVDSRHKPTIFVHSGGFVCNDGDGRVYPAEAPKNPGYGDCIGSYRDGIEVALGSGVVVPTEGGFAFPESSADWSTIGGSGGPAPDSQWPSSTNAAVIWTPNTTVNAHAFVTNGSNVYQCVTKGVTASSGGPTGTGSDIVDGTAHWKYLSAGTDVVVDRVSTRHLFATGTLESRQTLTGFTTRTAVHLDQSGSAESLSPNSTFANPVNDAVAWECVGQITSVTSAARTLIAMCTGNESVGGGALKIKITTAGLIQLFVNGNVVTTGVVDHRGSTVRRIVAGYDKANNVIFFYSPLEALTGSTVDATILNEMNKCFGANNGQTADWLCGPRSVFVGQRKIDTIRTTAWRTAMGVR